MDSRPQTEDLGTRTKRIYRRRVKNSSNVRRSSRVRVRRTDQDPKSDSERLDGRKRGMRWTTLEKQLLLRSLKEKSAVSQFNTLAIKRNVKTKKKSDVDMFIKNLRKRAVKAKIEAMRMKSPIEIWRDLMNHFGDQDRESLRVMSKVMVMASLERTKNAEEVTCDDFKPLRIYRYLGALFKSKELPVLSPLESQVILDCFENMLEVLKGSEVRDKAAFLRSQYFTLYNRAYTGGNEYSLEDNLSLVFKETEAEKETEAAKEAEPDQSHSNTASLQPRTDATSYGANPGTNRTAPGTIESTPGTDSTSGVTNPGTSGTEPGTFESIRGPHPTSSSANPGTSGTEPGTGESVPGTSGTVPKTSGAAPNGPRKRASWRGGVDRSTEVRILNPLGIPVEMLEFKPRDDKSHRKKHWTYEYETDSSDSDDTYGDDGDDSGDIDRRKGQVKKKRGRPRKRDRVVTSEDDAQDCAGTSPGETSGLQEMTELLNTDQYALVTEEEFARNGKIYLQAMAEAQAESDGHLDINEVVASEQYVFVAKDDVAREGENFVQGMEETEGREDDESQETNELDDTGQSKPTGKDFLGLNGESNRPEPSSALFGSEIDDQAENNESSENEGTASEIDQSEVIDDSIDQSELIDEDIGQSDADIRANHPDELGAEMSVVDDEDRGTDPSENMLPTSSTAFSHKLPPLKPTEGDDLINLVHEPAGSLAEQPSSRTVVQYLPQPDCSWIERPSQAISPQSLPVMTTGPAAAVDVISQSELSSSCEDFREKLTASSLPSSQATVSNPVQTNITQVLPDQHLHVASVSLRTDDTDIPSTNTPEVHTDRSESQGNVKSRPVRFLLPQKKSQPNESSLQETVGDSTPNTIPLVNALNRGMVSSDQSDDQLLTIDVSQLGPDSNIVIPSYLLPGGILTIRSPEVPHMRIQRSGLSSSVQTGTSSAITNDHLDLSSQSQAGISPTRQSQDGISADVDPESDVESSSEDDISQTEYVIASDQLSKDSHDLCEVHVIANRILKPSNQAEVPLKTAPKALQVVKKPEASPKKLQISKKSEASDILDGIQSEVVQPEIEERSFLEFLSSQKSAWNQRKRSTMPSGLSQKENDVSNSELEGLNMHVQAVRNVNIPISKSWQDKMKNCQYAASKSLIGVGKANGCQPQNISKHTTSAELESMKHKDESFPYTRSQPRDQMSLSQLELNTLSDLHAKEKRKRGRPPKYKPPITERSPLASEIQQGGSAGVSSEGKRKRGRPRKTDQRVPVDLDLVIESDEIPGHPVGGLDEQGVIVTPAESDYTTERVVGEKRKCGQPPKYAGINLQEERKTESHVGMEINAVTHSLSMSSSRSQGRMASVSNPLEDITKNVQETSTYIKELMNDSGDIIRGKLHNEKQERGRPPKVQNADASQQSHNPQISAMSLLESSIEKERKDKRIPHTVSFDLQRKVPTRQPKDSGWIASHSDTDSSAGSPQKRKRGRPCKGSRSDSLDNLQSSNGLGHTTEMETGIREFGTDSETDSGTEKRKRGRPRKGSRSNSLDNLQSSNGLSQSMADIGQLGTDSETDSGTEKRKRGRPHKESRPDSRDDLPDRTIASRLTECQAGTGLFETYAGSERQKEGKTGSSLKVFSPYQRNIGNSGSGNSERQKRGKPSKEIRPESCIDLPDRIIVGTSTVGRLSIDTGTAESERVAEFRGGPSKDVKKDKTETHILETDERMHGEEKRKRGRPPKQPRTESMVCLENTVMTNQSPESEINIGKLGTVSQTEIEVKRKRGRPRKESRSDSCDVLLDRNISSQVTENVEGIAQCESDSRTGREGTEERERPSSEFITNHPNQSTDVRTSTDQSSDLVEAVARMEKRKRGRPPIRCKSRKELSSNPSNSLPHPVAMTQSVTSDCFDSVRQSETVVRTETGDGEKKGGCHREIRLAPTNILLYKVTITRPREENKQNVRRYREIRPAPPKVDINPSREENKKKGRRSSERRPAPTNREIRPPPTSILLNRVTINPSTEQKRSISPLRSGADSSPDKQGKGKPCGNIRTDQSLAFLSDIVSRLEKGTKKRGRGRPRGEFHVNSSSDPLGREVQGQPRELDTSSSHLEQREEQEIGNPQKGSSNEMHARETKTHSEEKETSVSPSENQTGGEEKRKRGRPRKTGKLYADGSESPQKRKRGRSSKTVDMGSSNIDVESSVTKSRSPNKEAIKNHQDQQERAPNNVLPHGLDIQQSTNSETSIINSVSDFGREVEENDLRPHWRIRFASATQQTSVSKTLPTRELSIDQTPSEVAKHVSFSNDPPSMEAGTQQSPGKITRSILKKRRKRSPLKVNVGRALADKRQKSLDRTRQLEASSVGGKSMPFAKPFTSMFHESDLVFGKPKKQVSFEDAIDMMNTLDEGEVLGKNLFMTDVVSQTAMKEVIKIVKQVGVGRESIVAPQPQKKTSVFFSIKKS